MPLVTIYEDDTQKIEMPSALVKIFNKLINEYFTLKKEDMEKVLDKSVDYLHSTLPNEIPLEGKRIVTSSDVPRLSRGKIFELSTYGVLFEDAVLLLSEYFDRTKGKVNLNWKYQVEQLIKNHYDLSYDINCIVHFFDENYYGVSGFMALVKNDLLLIHFLYLNEDDISYRFPL